MAYLTKKTYKEKLLDPRWQKKRLEVLSKYNFTCCRCGDKTSTLHVHHLKYKENPWDVGIEDLLSLCDTCHKIAHINAKSLSPLELELIGKIQHIGHNCYEDCLASFILKDLTKIILKHTQNG